MPTPYEVFKQLGYQDVRPEQQDWMDKYQKSRDSIGQNQERMKQFAPPVAQQNKAAKYDYMGKLVGDTNSGVPISFADEGNAVESSMINQGRKQNMYNQRTINPEQAVTVRGNSGQAINKLATPMGVLPAIAGILGGAQGMGAAAELLKYVKTMGPQAGYAHFLGLQTQNPTQTYE
jgi:hypothetical protein